MIFKDKTVIITGGSEGVGAATARLFANAGANLMLVARGKKKLEAIAEELRDKTRVELFAMDVSDPEACVNLFKKAEFEYGRVDILVNNAGHHLRAPFESSPADEIAKMIDVNLKAPAMLMRLAIPHIQEAGGGAIINVGSLAGRTMVPGSAAYAATKAGLRSLTYSLAEELRGGNIKIAIVAPGPIDTGFIMDDIDSTTDLVFSQPLCSPEEVAQVILDLCGNNVREQCMHTSSRILSTLTYLFPWIGRTLRPMLEKKGARTKARIKAERKKAEQNSTEQKGRAPKLTDE
jgi:short-subunit dehydrogenase